MTTEETPRMTINDEELHDLVDVCFQHISEVHQLSGVADMHILEFISDIQNTQAFEEFDIPCDCVADAHYYAGVLLGLCTGLRCSVGDLAAAAAATQKRRIERFRDRLKRMTGEYRAYDDIRIQRGECAVGPFVAGRN